MLYNSHHYCLYYIIFYLLFNITVNILTNNRISHTLIRTLLLRAVTCFLAGFDLLSFRMEELELSIRDPVFFADIYHCFSQRVEYSACRAAFDAQTSGFRRANVMLRYRGPILFRKSCAHRYEITSSLSEKRRPGNLWRFTRRRRVAIFQPRFSNRKTRDARLPSLLKKDSKMYRVTSLCSCYTFILSWISMLHKACLRLKRTNIFL